MRDRPSVDEETAEREMTLGMTGARRNEGRQRRVETIWGAVQRRRAGSGWRVLPGGTRTNARDDVG